ncbi:uncharacterized protein LOC119602319 [Lucilia sericata]|uniref:uncharacterized protein LOC119602319 n=1 Tax=Lucilia sericata TaxID=13632 RepID=UPI0018A8042C|nr:uncharacterized protein LOC119602319 [Lucilia sericata]
MSEKDQIQTFVILDLETNGLPREQFNKCAITEISLYAIAAKCLINKDDYSRLFLRGASKEEVRFNAQPPDLPRVLNKITLMVRPGVPISSISEKVTGLNNEMLENESPFDESTANCINIFLERLKAPICLVAQNGWEHDYPIIRYVYEKLNKLFPSSIFCVDSLKAFREIDEKYNIINNAIHVMSMLEEKKEEPRTYDQTSDNGTKDLLDLLELNSQINWQKINETTPRKKRKETKEHYFNSLINEVISLKKTDEPSKKLRLKRALFTDDFTLSKYPAKGVYKLGNIYRRCFKQEPINLHRAEMDVEVLTKLILHYGIDFLAYAEERKQLFVEVPKLGSSTN